MRLTLPLPTGPRHVHCYFLRGDDGWTLVDTGLGLMETPWDEILAQLDGEVVRIFITHMHPDHVGGAEAAAAATGAPVIQGRLDYAQCERVWGSDDWPERIAEWFIRHGVPPRRVRGADRVGARVRGLRPLRLEPDARRAGRRDRRLAGRRDARPRRRAPEPPSRRRADRGRHAADADHAGDRALPGEPARPARRLPRHARAPRRARAAHLVRRPRACRCRGPAARCAEIAAHHDGPARPHGGRARCGAALAASRSRTISSGTSCRRSSAASPSPRRCRTSSGSSSLGPRRAERRRPQRHLYCALRRWTTSPLVPTPRGLGA